MASTKALCGSALASVYWRDDNKRDNIWVYYIDVYGWVCQVKSYKGEWIAGSQQCFKAPRFNTPLAAVVYPDYSKTSRRPSANPEIHIFCIAISDTNTPSIRRFIKTKNTDSWEESEKDIPSENLLTLSSIAAIEYKDTHVRVFWQDTTHNIRQTICNTSDGSDWAVEKEKISEKPAWRGTPIAAAAVSGLRDSLTSVLAYRHSDRTLVVARIETDPAQILFLIPTTEKYDMSPTGSVALVAWSFGKIWVFYEGFTDGLHRLRLYKSPEKTSSVFTGNITTVKAADEGSLAGAAVPADSSGNAPASIFYQPPGEINIVEMRLEYSTT
ncbi:hypothetical protein SISNIDRAFT_285641 [Sistotremastrum niveocremeum HHB9708]|uniref:Fucose-specific lectin n=1 Tax=Sistotremastrum niveocremeum HHB9708 TaxID=1314777 RepID=A0A164YBP5_9AGAM|nr:hypothetical protein SISNIDRAFT_285641 [Sistotremastrum niveocremeum HHB9708]